MNQKGFSNIIIILIVLGVVLVGVLGYVVLVKKPVVPPITDESTANWQALSFYSASWSEGLHSIYVNREGNATVVHGGMIEVRSYTCGKMSKSSLASIQELLNAVNIPKLKPSYDFPVNDKVHREFDKFNLRLLYPDKKYVISGAFDAAPVSLQKFFNDLVSLVEKQTERCDHDQLQDLFLRAVPLPKGKETENWIKYLRKEEIIVPVIDEKKFNELPCLAKAIKEEGSIVPCEEADLAKKYLLGTGEAEINGNYYDVEFFYKEPNAE